MQFLHKHDHDYLLIICVIFFQDAQDASTTQPTSPVGEPSLVYTRWGASSCPNSAELIYAGTTHQRMFPLYGNARVSCLLQTLIFTYYRPTCFIVPHNLSTDNGDDVYIQFPLSNTDYYLQWLRMQMRFELFRNNGAQYGKKEGHRAWSLHEKSRIR